MLISIVDAFQTSRGLNSYLKFKGFKSVPLNSSYVTMTTFIRGVLFKFYDSFV